MILDPNGTFGKPVRGDFPSILQVDFSDPANDLQAKRNSYHTSQDSMAKIPTDPSTLCYFIQESETESQITCRLRFTRSKFNFNPFGLRFGKRQEGTSAGDRNLASWSSSKILQALLKPRPARRADQCGDAWGEEC
uniref:Uncharacterized protein n=1 Tax=Varanus komodoensis TaxID=61221 RepID=A0A8D2LCJ1_VARKO